MKLYELSETGRKLTNMFLEEEIDEQTLEDSRELIKAEIEVNGGDLIDFYNSFTRFLGTGTGDKKVIGDIDQQINRLKKLKEFYKKRFARFSASVTDCLLDLGVKTGQSNNPRFGFKHTEIDVTTAPAEQKSTRIFFSDKNDKWISEIGFYQKTDGNILSQITANNDTSGTALLQIICNKDGRKYATCPTPPDAADSSTKIATTAWVNSRITSIMNNKLQVVSSLPSSPKADTFYFIPED